MNKEYEMCIKKMFWDKLHDIEAKYEGLIIDDELVKNTNDSLNKAIKSLPLSIRDKFDCSFHIDFDFDPRVPVVSFETDFHDWLVTGWVNEDK